MFKVTVDDGMRDTLGMPSGIYHDLGTVHSIREGFVKFKEWVDKESWDEQKEQYQLEKKLDDPGLPDWVDRNDNMWYFVSDDGASLVFDYVDVE